MPSNFGIPKPIGPTPDTGNTPRQKQRFEAIGIWGIYSTACVG